MHIAASKTTVKYISIIFQSSGDKSALGHGDLPIKKKSQCVLEKEGGNLGGGMIRGKSLPLYDIKNKVSKRE